MMEKNVEQMMEKKESVEVVAKDAEVAVQDAEVVAKDVGGKAPDIELFVKDSDETLNATNQSNTINSTNKKIRRLRSHRTGPKEEQ